MTRTSRQVFASWRRSRVGQEVIRDIKRRQLFMCVSCRKQLSNDCHVHHLKPIMQLESNDPAIFSEDNLVLLCSKCNLTFPKNVIDKRFE